MHGLLFKTPDYVFLDFKLFEDLPLADFGEVGEGYDVAARLTAVAPTLSELPKDDTLFNWLLRRINHLSDGRLTLDSEYGDEGSFPLSILATRGTTPVAILDFEGDDYGIRCFPRGTDAEECDAAVSEFVEACAANPKQTREIPILGDE